MSARPLTPTRSGPARVAGILLLALANYVAGRLGLLLAIPPGFATAVFPPSGIALGALLVFGARLWPGVFLGSLAFNLHLALGASPEATALGAAPVALGIALGSSLQALLGAALVRRQLGGSLALDDERSVGAFFLLGGPLSCLVAATLGIATLTLAGAMTDAHVWNWFVWWTGDSIGVLVFAPLVIAAFGEPYGLWRARRFAVGLPLLGAFLVAVGVFAYASDREQARVETDFAYRSDALVQAVRDELETHLEVLQGIVGLFASSERVERHEFRVFVERSLARLEAIRALEWVPRVPGAERVAHEEAVRREGWPDFAFRRWSAEHGWVRDDLGWAREYFPVQFIEPMEGNEPAFGIDMLSNPTRRKAIQLACDTGRPVVTAGLSLVQGPARNEGLIALVPHYEGGPVDTVEARRERLRGFVVGVFLVEDIVRHGLASISRPGIVLEIVDHSGGAGDGRVIFRDGGESSSRPLRAEARLSFHGLDWSFRCSTGAAYPSDAGWQPWAMLAGGLVFTGMLGGLLLLLTGRTSRVEQLVTRLRDTAGELERSNQDLDAFAYVASHDMQAPLRGISQLAAWIEKDASASLPPESRQHLRLLQARVQRMKDLLDDLLAYARVGRTTAEVEDVDVEELVRDVASMLDLPEGFVVRTPGRLKRVRTPRVPLQQVLLNLVGNAIKHHDRTSGQVEVEMLAAGGGWMRVLVRDDGPGIPAEHHERVFEMLTTLKPRDEVEGSGMGLAIVKRLVRTFGGDLFVVPTEGRGTTIELSWPAEPLPPGPLPSSGTASRREVSAPI